MKPPPGATTIYRLQLEQRVSAFLGVLCPRPARGRRQRQTRQPWEDGGFGLAEHRERDWELQSPKAGDNAEVSSPQLLSSLRCSFCRTNRAAFQQHDTLFAVLCGFTGLILFACRALAGNRGFGAFGLWGMPRSETRSRGNSNARERLPSSAGSTATATLG